jgi:PPIC-type PPIASE domain
MRRLFLVAGILAVSGCSNFRDLLSAHADVAAEAAGQTLTTDRLAEMMGRAKGAQMTRETADFMTSVWTDYTLFAQAVAAGKIEMDSAALSEVLWPEIAEAKGAHWYDTLVTRRTKLAPTVADSVYRADSVRVLQHILFTAQPTATAEERTTARRSAERTLAQVRGGANFGLLASQLSGDPGSRRDAGFLPPSARGAFVTAFDSAGWRLAPGQVSGVVETPFGYHIIRRPAMEEVRQRIITWLGQDASRRLDSIYMDSLGVANDLKISDQAPTLMRAALEDREGKRGSKKALVTFKSGSPLTVGDFLRWLGALPPQFAGQVREAPDEQLKQFARALATNQLLLRQADSAGISLSPVEWQALEQGYRFQVDSLKMSIGLGADVTDSTVSLADRRKVAALRVETFFNDLLDGRARLRPLPSTLAQVLRDRDENRTYSAGLQRAVELAEAAKAAEGAPAGAPQPTAPGTTLQPAPGGAPVGGQPGNAPAPAKP